MATHPHRKKKWSPTHIKGGGGHPPLQKETVIYLHYIYLSRKFTTKYLSRRRWSFISPTSASKRNYLTYLSTKKWLFIVPIYPCRNKFRTHLSRRRWSLSSPTWLSRKDFFTYLCIERDGHVSPPTHLSKRSSPTNLSGKRWPPSLPLSY